MVLEKSTGHTDAIAPDGNTDLVAGLLFVLWDLFLSEQVKGLVDTAAIPWDLIRITAPTDEQPIVTSCAVGYVPGRRAECRSGHREYGCAGTQQNSSEKAWIHAGNGAYVIPSKHDPTCRCFI